MKKNYIYLAILIIMTIVITFLLSSLYKNENDEVSYSYKKMNRITSEEFDEYMLEHSDVIIYISDKFDLTYNKLEKKLINKLEKLNLIKNVIYIDKNDMNDSLKTKFNQNYLYKYDETNLPVIIVINDGVLVESVEINQNTAIESVIDYEVFK